MFILEQKYGNDGYAFWFKLLEMIGNTEGHCLVFKNGVDWEFLEAKTRVEKDTCKEIMELLSNMKAIDKQLWQKDKKVWIDNFVENVKDAYRNRVVDIPDKPDILRKKPHDNKDNLRKETTDEMKEDEMKEDIKKHPVEGWENVMLTDKEFESLNKELGEAQASDFIERLHLYKGSTGKSYKSDYLTILNWRKKEARG